MNRGFRWLSSTYNGLFSNHNTELNLTISTSQSDDGDIVFAPTALPSASACVEMATTHRRTGFITRHLAGWWDWCLPTGKPNSASLEEDMTSSTWQSRYTYVSTIDGGRYFTIQISPNGSTCWRGLIYNFSSGTWELKLASCYPPGRTTNWTGNGNEGWSQWEAAGGITKTCPNLNGTRTSITQVFHPSLGWRDINVVSNINQGNLCWLRRSDWTMTQHDGGSGSFWRAFTPGP